MTGRRSFGAVRQKPNGAWEARYKAESGKTVYRYFQTKKEATAYLSTVQADMLRGDWIDPMDGKITVRELSVLWREGQHNLRPSTARLYDTLLRNHVLPVFGHRTIAAITADDVDAWVASMLANPKLSSSTANRAYRVLRQMMKLAVRRRRIRVSPCDGVQAPKDAKAEMLFLTPQQVATLADTIDPYYRTFVLMAVYSGLRWGELAGLKVARLDWINRTVTVLEQLTDEGVLAPPKSEAGRRVVTLPQWLVPLLKEQVAGKALDEFVFTSDQGAGLRASNFNRRVWRRGVTAALPADLHGLRFHDLRHTAVAIAIASGAARNPKALQVRMGHSTITMTLDRYGHLLPGQDADIADGMVDPFTIKTDDTNVVPLRRAEGDG